MLDALNLSIETVAKNAVKELKAIKFGGTGKYSKGWKSKVIKTRLGTDAVVYNAKQYYLTHLLEYGHAKQNGGRVEGQEHIGTVNNKVGDEVVEELEKRL